MPETIIRDWDDAKIADFGRKPLRFSHAAHQSDLFSDATLAQLLEQVERDNYYVNTMSVGEDGKRRRREGQFGDLSGREILDAVHGGHIWILLLYPETVNPGYGRLLDEIYAEVEAHVPGLQVRKKKISILISSPNIPVFYHCDMAGQTLWQVRGEKTVYVYPNREPYLPQANLEKIALGEAHEISLPYDAAWDADADVFKITPGDMLHWPLNAPHRIDNGNMLNVSFTTEHVTTDVHRNYVVNFGNGILRRTTGMQRLSQRTTGPVYWSRFAATGAARVLGLQRGREQTFKVDFAVDPSASGGFRDIAAFEFRK